MIREHPDKAVTKDAEAGLKAIETNLPKLKEAVGKIADPLFVMVGVLTVGNEETGWLGHSLLDKNA